MFGRAAVLGLVMLAACQPATTPTTTPTPSSGATSVEAPEHQGGTLVLADWEQPDTLDPLHATTLNDLRVASLLFASLWGLGPDLAPYPDLARQVPSVANGDVKLGRDGVSMTIDVKLVPGLRWSDGQAITADDVIFTVDAICSADLPSPDRAGFDRIASQERRSDTEVVWHLGPRPKGSCGLAADLASGIYPAYLLLGPHARLLPSHRLALVPLVKWPSEPFFQRPDASSGPFRFASSVGGRLLDLAANPAYAAGRAHPPYLGGVSYRFYNGKAAMTAGLQAGEADLGFHLLPDDLASLKGLPGSATVVSPSLQGEYLNPNHASNTGTGRAPPWVADVPVLQALARAIDRTALNAAAFGTVATESRSLFPALLGPYSRPVLAETADLPGARRLLDSDGWAVGPGGVRSKSGRRLEFTLLTTCDSAPRQAEQAELSRQWASVGAAVQTSCLPRPDFFAANAAGAFDLSLYSNTWEPDPSAWAPLGMTGSAQNWNRCADGDLDRYFAAGGATLDAGRRAQAYSAGAAVWLRYGCTIPLLEWPGLVLRPVGLHNFKPDPSGLDTGNAADWWV